MHGTFITSDPHSCQYHKGSRNQSGKSTGLGVRHAQVQTPALPLPLCEILAVPFPLLGFSLLLRTLICTGDPEVCYATDTCCFYSAPPHQNTHLVPFPVHSGKKLHFPGSLAPWFLGRFSQWEALVHD